MTWAGKKGRDMNSARGKNTHTKCVRRRRPSSSPVFIPGKEKNKKNLVGNVYKKRRRNSFTKDKVKPKWLAPKAQSTLWSGSERTSLSFTPHRAIFIFFTTYQKDFLKESHTQPVLSTPKWSPTNSGVGGVYISFLFNPAVVPVRCGCEKKN